MAGTREPVEITTSADPGGMEKIRKEVVPTIEAVAPSEGHVAMRKPDGSVVEVPSNQADLKAATREGYELAAPAEVYRSQQGAAGSLLAEGTGAIRGLSVGASDYGLVETARLVKGDEKAEQVRQELNLLKQAYGRESTGGEIGGLLAGAFAVPAAAPGGGMARFGLRAMGEGAAMGAGGYLGESALQGQPLSAEALGVHMLKSALLMGGLAGATGAVGKGIAGLGRAAVSREARAAELAGRLSNPVDRIAAGGEDLAALSGIKTTPMGLAGKSADRISELYAKAMGRLGTGEEGAVRALTRLDEVGQRTRGVIANEARVLDEVQRAGHKALEGILEGSRLPGDLFSGAAKTKAAERLVDPSKAIEVAQFTKSSADKARDVAGILESVGLTKPAKDLLRTADAVEAKVPALLSGTNPASAAAQAFEASDMLKRTAKDLRAVLSKEMRSTLPIDRQAVGAARGAVEALESDVRAGLERTDIWGRMGEAQASTNSKWTELIRARGEFEKAFTSEVGGKRIVDQAKVSRFFKDASEAKAPLRGVVRSYVDAVEGLAGDVAKYTQLEPKAAAALKKQVAGVKTMRRLMDVAEERTAALNQLKSVGHASGLGIDKAAALGWLVGGAGGAVAGKVASAMANPRTVVEVLAKAEAARRMVSEAYGSALGRMAEGKSVKLGKSVVEGLTDKQIMALRDEVAVGGAQGRIEEFAKPIHDRAPDLAMGVLSATGRSLTWLTENLPKVTPQPSIMPSGRTLPPTTADLFRSRRKLEIFFEPERAGDLLASGRLLSDHVTTLRDVYPEHMAELQAQIAYITAARNPEYSVQQEMSLRLFFDAPTGTIFDHVAVQQYQSIYQQPAPAGQQASPGAKMPIKGTRRLATETDERDKS